AVARLVGSLDTDDRDIGVIGPVDDRSSREELGAFHPMEVDVGRTSQGEDVGVLEEHERAPLRLVSALPSVRLTHDVTGTSGVDVGIVEETEPELVGQQPPNGDVDALLLDTTRAHEIDHDLRAGLAAELVDTGLDHLQHAFLPAQGLDSPGAGGPADAARTRVTDQAPVGAHDAVEPVAVPQQPRDHAVVEAEPDLL